MMMKITSNILQTGRGSISPKLLIAIWSVSAVISLPGLAISPILGELDKIFKHTTHLEIQMLTSLPSLLIIPFVLLAGKLSVSQNKLRILYIGLTLFFVSGFCSLFAKDMVLLIAISCLLGIGAGMVIPLSTGLIADYFTGSYRTRQLGISSAISNVTLVFATSLTGWLATMNWHYPFLVYLLPGISLLLTFSLQNQPPPVASKSNSDAAIPASRPTPAHETTPLDRMLPGIHLPRLAGLMLLYFFTTYAVLAIVFNLPFLMQGYGFSSSAAGMVISLFFLAIMLPGLFITPIMDRLRDKTVCIALLLMGVGLLLIFLFKNGFMMGLGAMTTGLGYGVIQPMIYDKCVLTATPAKTTLALALVMSVNYLAILLCPFIVDLFVWIFHAAHPSDFSFVLNGVLTLIATGICYKYRNTFLFGHTVEKE